MSVANEKVSEVFAMNGSQTVFSVTSSRITDTDTIFAFVTDTTTETDTTLVPTVDFTVAIVTENSYTVTVTDPRTSDFELTVYRELDILQESDYTDYGSFPAETTEDDLDKIILICQQLDDGLARSLQLQIGTTGVSTVLPSPLADATIGWNSTGTALVNNPGATPGTFTSLTDTPSNYIGHALKQVRVNAGETGLEFGVAGGGGSAEEVTEDINQTTHGFAVGDVLRHNGTSYTEAQADSESNAEVIGIVSAVAGANDFTLLVGGRITGLTGLTAGSEHYLSPSSAGALTTTEPSTSNQVSKPVLVADSTTTGFFFNMRGRVIP